MTTQKRELVYKKEPYTSRFKDWILNRTIPGIFINNYILRKEVPEYIHLKTIATHFVQVFKNTLSRLFPFDGYDTINQEITYHNNKKGPVYKDHNFGWLTLLAFFGLPTRPHAVKAKDGTLNPSLTLVDVLINLIGGWKSPAENLSRRQYILQWIALFTVKPLVILPLNIITGVIKLLQNIIKLIVFVPFTMAWFILSQISYALMTLTYNVVKSNRPLPLKIIPTAIWGTLSLISLIDIPLLIVSRVLPAIIMPLVSIKNSNAKGREVAILSDKFRRRLAMLTPNTTGEKATKNPPDPIADLIGGASALGSFFITAFAWAIILPLLVGAVMTFFPALIPAVVATLGWVAHVPFITAAYSAAQSVLAVTIIPSMVASVIPIISTLTTALGLQISASLVVSLATVGFSAACIGVPTTYYANKFSDWYVSWYGPAEKVQAQREEVELKETHEKDNKGEHDFDNPPSPDAQRQRKQLADAEKLLNASGDAVTSAEASASTPPADPKGKPPVKTEGVEVNPPDSLTSGVKYI